MHNHMACYVMLRFVVIMRTQIYMHAYIHRQSISTHGYVDLLIQLMHSFTHPSIPSFIQSSSVQ